MNLITKFSFLGLMGKMGKNIEWNTGTAAVTTWKRRGRSNSYNYTSSYSTIAKYVPLFYIQPFEEGKTHLFWFINKNKA